QKAHEYGKETQDQLERHIRLADAGFTESDLEGLQIAIKTIEDFLDRTEPRNPADFLKNEEILAQELRGSPGSSVTSPEKGRSDLPDPTPQSDELRHIIVKQQRANDEMREQMRKIADELAEIKKGRTEGPVLSTDPREFRVTYRSTKQRTPQ